MSIVGDILRLGHVTAREHRWIAGMGAFQWCSGLDEFRRFIDRQHVIAHVIRVGDAPVGFCAYELTGDVDLGMGQVVLREFAIDPRHRLRGNGALALWTIIRTKLNPGRPYLTATVDERNLDAQRWLRACHVKAVNVARGYFGDRDGITFQLRREF